MRRHLKRIHVGSDGPNAAGLPAAFLPYIGTDLSHWMQLQVYARNSDPAPPAVFPGEAWITEGFLKKADNHVR